VEQQGIFWLTSCAGTRVTGDLSRVVGELSCAWPFLDGITISRLVSGFLPCTSLPPLLSWSYMSPGSPSCLAPDTTMPTLTSSPGETSPRRTSTDTPPALPEAGIPVSSGLVPTPPTPADVAGPGGSSRVTTTIKTEMPRPAVAGTSASKGKQEWTPTRASPGRLDAGGVTPDVASSPDDMSFLESLCEGLRADMAGAVETLITGRTPGRMASPSADMGRSGNRVVTGGGGDDDGGPDGTTSGDSRRDRRLRRNRNSHRRRRPRSSSSDSSSRSDGEADRRTLVDFQIPVHKVRDNLLNTVTDWHSYHLDDQNQTFTSRTRLRITQERKKLRASMDRVRFDVTKPAELFSFLRRCVRACNASNVREGKALYLFGSFLPGAAATRFNRSLPDTAGLIPGRTVASFPEAVHWPLVNNADSITLNQAVSDVNRASLGAHEVPDAFAARLRDLGEACENVYGEGRLKMALIQGLSDRGCHGYMREENFHAIYPYPLRIRSEDAYLNCNMRKRGEVISILSDKKCEIISGPYPRSESQDTGIYKIMKLLKPAEF